MPEDPMVYRRLLQRCSEARTRAQFELDTHWLVPGVVDEVSILFKHEHELVAFAVHFARKNGLEHIGSVDHDTCTFVVRDENGRMDRPGESFQVRFEFLKIPGCDWRIEAMCILDGVAPLHRACRNHEIVHASFKCIDFGHYLHVVDVLGHKLPLNAEYVNSYGQFGYFGGITPYIKPRVNLRDRQEAAQRG